MFTADDISLAGYWAWHRASPPYKEDSFGRKEKPIQCRCWFLLVPQWDRCALLSILRCRRGLLRVPFFSCFFHLPFFPTREKIT